MGFSAAALAVSLFSVSEQVKAGEAQEDAAKEAKKLSKLQAERTAEETAESVRRTELAQAQLEGVTRARIAASGVHATGSMAAYMEEMKKTHVGEVDWMKKAGATAVEATEIEGKYAAKSAAAGAKSTYAGAIGSLGSSISSASEIEWWG